MISNRIMLIFGVLFVAFVFQSFGSFLQVKAYQKAIKRCRPLGTLGFGQKKSFFMVRGNIVIIGSDKDGIITGGEIMEGATIFARFKPLKKMLGRPIVGESIYDYLAEFRELSKSKQKMYKGHIQALEALEMRFDQERMRDAVPEQTEVEAVESIEYTSDDDFDIDDL